MISRKKVRVLVRLAIILFVFAFILSAIFGGLYYVAIQNTEDEWNEKVEPHDESIRWGIVEAISNCLKDDNRYCLSTPNFLPVALWDNEACAAMIRNTLNYIFGEERFANSPAWTFARENSDKLVLVYDRANDFSIDGSRVVENKDSGFRLSKLLSRKHLYVLGYHYRETRSDSKIIDANAFINSHLMLLLPKQNNGWHGYHLVHIKDEHPVRFDRIDEMPKLFDLVYIWRISGMLKPDFVEPIVLYQNTLDYKTAIKWLRFGFPNERISSYIDSIAVYFANKIHGTEQFPYVVRSSLLEPIQVVSPKNKSSCRHNSVLGFYRGEPIFCHNGENKRSAYGLKNQCVEFVNRFLARVLHHKNLTKSGDANSYFYEAEAKGLARFEQNGFEAPKVNDILVHARSGRNFCEHVSVVSSVEADSVCVVQQNTHPRFEPWYVCHKLNSDGSRYSVTGSFCPVIGWVRVKERKGEKNETVPGGSWTSGDSSSTLGWWGRSRLRWMRMRDASDSQYEVIGFIKVKRGDKLTELTQTAGAQISATLLCNPELHSKHDIYVNQVLSLCK